MILLTGATGFVGQALLAVLQRRGERLRVATRQPYRRFAPTIDHVLLPDLTHELPHTSLFAGVHTVIHLAARAHQLQDRGDDAAAYWAVNCDATQRLAAKAAGAGVRHFIYLSSVKAMGESTALNHPFDEQTIPRPTTPYGQSKLGAEQALEKIAASSQMAVTMLRPPLVYGAGVGANFLKLMELVEAGWPLPLGLVANQRSFIYLENLVSAVLACLNNPAAYNRLFLLSDGAAISTPMLLRQLAMALGVRARIFPCPVFLIRPLLPRPLLDNLAVSSQLIQRQLAWQPPFSMAEGLRATANWYRYRQQEYIVSS